MRRRRRSASFLAVVVVIAAAYVAQKYSRLVPGVGAHRASSSVPTGDQAVAEAFRDRASGVLLEVTGTVHSVLADDVEGGRHQRFILKLISGGTVLVAHNIDLATRVPLGPGDAVRLRGRYEWNERGGVVHWTHRDPQRRGADGWIEHRGQRYE